jgi:hypothetical protein
MANKLHVVFFVLYEKLFDFFGVRSGQNIGFLILFISGYTPAIFTVSLSDYSFMKSVLFQI